MRLVRLLAVFVCGAIAIVLIVRPLIGIAPIRAFSLVVPLLLLGMLLALIGVIAIVIGILRANKTGVVIGAQTALPGSLPFIVCIVLVGPGAFLVPPIHDISTDLIDPPVFVTASEMRRPEENPLDHGGAGVAGQQRRHYPDLQTLMLTIPAWAVYARAVAMVDEFGWEVLRQDDERWEIEAAARSRLFGFVDDVIIRIRASETGSRVDMRSASRVGTSDLGANARRIRGFLAGLGEIQDGP